MNNMQDISNDYQYVLVSILLNLMYFDYSIMLYVDKVGISIFLYRLLISWELSRAEMIMEMFVWQLKEKHISTALFA